MLRGVSVIALLLVITHTSSFNSSPAAPAGLHSRFTPHTTPLNALLSDSADSLTTDNVSSANPGVENGVISHIVEERRAFELQLGSTIEILNADYPDLLKAPPTYDIYNNKIQVVDPSGVQAVRGIDQYKNLFSLLRMCAGLFYSTQTSFIEHKLVYDWVRSQIRVSFKITLVKSSSVGKSSHQEAMDAVLGTKASSRNDHTVVSGISEYFVDSEGKILKHVISNIIINDKPVTVGLGMGELFSLQRGKVAGVGASIGMIRSTAQASPATALKSYGFGGSSNRLEAQRNSALRSTFSRLFMTVSDSSFDDNFDELARQRKALEADLEKKNQARAKFNLKPMTMFEYEQLLDENAKVVDNFRSYQQQMEAANEPAESKRGEGTPAVVNLFSAVISAILPKNIDAPKMCTTFEDCDDGQECCDLLVAKVCCNSGLGSHAYMPELDLIPVRIDDEPDYNPGEQGRGVRGPWQMDE